MKSADTGSRKGGYLGWIIGAAIVVTAILIGVSLAQNRPKLPDNLVADADMGAKRNVWGQESAKVTVEEYGDYLCPACVVAYEMLEEKLQPLVEQGDVKFVYHHLIVNGARARFGAEAAECAADQGMFWAYHKTLLQDRQQGGEWTKGRLTEIAGDLGLDTTTFGQCLSDGTHVATVEAQDHEGTRRGVAATPSFFVNGKPIHAQTVESGVEAVMNAVQEEMNKR